MLIGVSYVTAVLRKALHVPQLGHRLPPATAVVGSILFLVSTFPSESNLIKF